MTKKICPLMSNASRIKEATDICAFDTFNEVECKENKCTLWVSGYTTEHRTIQCCVFEFMAMKNSEGLYQV